MTNNMAEIYMRHILNMLTNEEQVPGPHGHLPLEAISPSAKILSMGSPLEKNLARIPNSSGFVGTLNRVDQEKPTEQDIEHDRLSFSSNPKCDPFTDTNLKRVAAEFFRLNITTFGRGLDPGTRLTVYQVYVDERFTPDGNIKGQGIIGAITPVGVRGEKSEKNRWILFALLCLWEQLGVAWIAPLDAEDGLDRREEPDYDQTWEVNQTFKKIYNAVIDYYENHSEEIQTTFECPLLKANSENEQVEKLGIYEVDTKPWLAKSEKYDLSQTGGLQGAEERQDNPTN